MLKPYLLPAVCTPLHEDESLHVEGLAAHLDAQWTAGAAGVLIAGSMGQMQLLRDDTYRALIRESACRAQGRGELLVGIGDAGYARTRERLQVVLEETREAPVQGVVAVTPFFFKFPQQELIRYYHRLADESPLPVFLYYLPGVTGVSLELSTVVEIARHQNVVGIKCSCDLAWAQQLKEMMAGVRSGFRIIVAQPHLCALLPKIGFAENLDGIFAVLPGLMRKLIDACTACDQAGADWAQAKFSEVLRLLVSSYGVFPACEALLNAQGVPGRLSAAPLAPLSAEMRARLLAEPLIAELLALPR